MVSTIAILGSGTMGQGIAQVAALAGFKVTLFDLNKVILSKALKKIESNLEKGKNRGKITGEEVKKALGNLELETNIELLKSDMFIEAVVEDLGVKQSLFSDLQKTNPNSILATNTSSLPVTQIAAGVPDPTKVVGMHFFNPAYIMKLVEVIRGVHTSDSTATVVIDVAGKLGKTAVLVNDSPGFIVNRVARQFYVESLNILEEQASDVEGIDQLLEASGFKMGPFRLMDLIGVDTNLSVTQTMFNQFHQNSKFRPSRIQQQMVDAGNYGKKSGKGFYNYDQV